MKFECAICRNDIDISFVNDKKLTGVFRVCRYCVSVQLGENSKPTPKPKYSVTTHTSFSSAFRNGKIRNTGHSWLQQYEDIRREGRYSWQDYCVSIKRRCVGGAKTKFLQGEPWKL